jgi:hypothetical protein
VIIHVEAAAYSDVIRNGDQTKWRMMGVNSNRVVYIYPFEDNEHWTAAVFENSAWLVLKMNMNTAVTKLNGVRSRGDWGPG